jgi:hypothetical protein
LIKRRDEKCEKKVTQPYKLDNIVTICRIKTL